MARKQTPKPLDIGQKTSIKVTNKKIKGLITTEEETKEYAEEIYKIELAKILNKIKEIAENSKKAQTTGLIVGSLMTLIGGVFAGALIVWMQYANSATTFLVWVCGIMFVLSLFIIFISDKRKKN